MNPEEQNMYFKELTINLKRCGFTIGYDTD